MLQFQTFWVFLGQFKHSHGRGDIPRLLKCQRGLRVLQAPKVLDVPRVPVPTTGFHSSALSLINIYFIS